MRDGSTSERGKKKAKKGISLEKDLSSFPKNHSTKDSFMKTESTDLALWSLRKVTFMKDNGPRDINTAMASFMMLRPIEFIKESSRTASSMGWVC